MMPRRCRWALPPWNNCEMRRATDVVCRFQRLGALCTNQAKTADAAKWYGASSDELASAAWCITEFASALGIKQRTGQLTEPQAQAAWAKFERMCANDLQLLPVDAMTFHQAAKLTMDAAAGLRAGDALHLVPCRPRQRA